MKNILHAIVITILITGCATNSQIKPINTVKVLLPETMKWEQILNKEKDGNYVREWVPEGRTLETAKWIVVEQKFRLKQTISAESYMKTLFGLTKFACTDVKFNGPEKMVSSGHQTYVGRVMCAQQKGKNYGMFTDQRVIAQGNDIYVVTSELRLPISDKAGSIPFPDGKLDSIKEFMERQALSAKLVRSVLLCTDGVSNC